MCRDWIWVELSAPFKTWCELPVSTIYEQEQIPKKKVEQPKKVEQLKKNTESFL